METTPDVLTISASDLAQALDVTTARIRQMAEEGTVVRSKRGRYDLIRSVRGYVKSVQERKLNQHSGTPASGDAGDYETNRARLTKAKAEMAEMEVSKMRGETLDAKAVEQVVGEMLMDAKSKLEAFEFKLNGLLEGLDTLATRAPVIRGAVAEALTELSKYDAGRITEAYISTHNETLDTEAEPDGEPVGRPVPATQ
jgi:hypothetical protein